MKVFTLLWLPDENQINHKFRRSWRGREGIDFSGCAKVIVVVHNDKKRRKLSQMFTYKMSIPSPFLMENAFIKERKEKEM